MYETSEKNSYFVDEYSTKLHLLTAECDVCVYKGAGETCQLNCRFRDAKKGCRCFHRAEEPFEGGEISNEETKDIEIRLLRAEIPEFREVKMIWVNNHYYDQVMLIYNVYDFGNILGLTPYETEIFMLKNCKKKAFSQMQVPKEDGGPEDWYMRADGVRQMALEIFLLREKENKRLWFYDEWVWISEFYLKWMPQFAKNFFDGQSLLDV